MFGVLVRCSYAATRETASRHPQRGCCPVFPSPDRWSGWFLDFPNAPIRMEMAAPVRVLFGPTFFLFRVYFRTTCGLYPYTKPSTMVLTARLELATSAMSLRHSSQLSYASENHPHRAPDSGQEPVSFAPVRRATCRADNPTEERGRRRESHPLATGQRRHKVWCRESGLN